MYGLLTPTRTKVLAVVGPGPVLRDGDVRHLLKNVHKAYVEATACNPFHETGKPVVSRRFDACLLSLLAPVDATTPPAY